MIINSKKLIAALAVTAAAAVVGGIHVTSADDTTGPSSSASPYVVSVSPNVATKSILTVGDAVNVKSDGVSPYRLVGIPDGLGAFDNGDGTFTVLMNHELGATAGVIRDHGARGAFVSKWTIRKDDLTVLKGEDLIQKSRRGIRARAPSTRPRRASQWGACVQPTCRPHQLSTTPPAAWATTVAFL